MVRHLQRQMRVLLDQEDRRALAVELGHDVENLAHHERSETERRLVHQQEARPRHERPRHRQHLLLAARERAGQLLAPPAQRREALIHALDVGQHVGLVAALIGARREVLPDAHLREHQPVLGHQRDARRDDAGRRLADKLAAIERDGAAPRREHAGDVIIRVVLPAPFGTEQAGDLAPATESDTPFSASILP